MKLTKKQIDAIEKIGFTVKVFDDYISFQWVSPAGQDFDVEINLDGEKKAADLYSKILDEYMGYDPSEEAMLWLDPFGHGKNGAPYEMGDVYDDMCACQDKLNELCDVFAGF